MGWDRRVSMVSSGLDEVQASCLPFKALYKVFTVIAKR